MPNLGISVIVCTKSEAPNIARCLESLRDFDDVVVVDSGSTDNTPEIARDMGFRVENFVWNGVYPKKRQWCLDNLELKHDWVFFVDADEVVTPAIIGQLRNIDHTYAGYFVRGQYVFEGKLLSYGLQNNKLALLNRCKVRFPIVNDLDIKGMGEIEGHYQPCVIDFYKNAKVGQITAALHHYAYERPVAWKARHERYARWEAGMDLKFAWPDDCRFSKRLFRNLPAKPLVAFLHSYVFKQGFKDGKAGLKFALSRMRYYRMTRRAFANARIEQEKDLAKSEQSFAGQKSDDSAKNAQV